MKVYLHAGTHKTGTTSVQNWLSENRGVLAEHGILYPELKSLKSQHSKFLNEYTLGTKEHQIDDARLFETQVAEREWQSIILSGEAVSVLNAGALKRLSARLARFDVQPVLVLREWPAILFSRWKQDVKRRDAWPFTSYIEQLERLNFAHDDCAYERICARFLESFAEPPILIGYEAGLQNHSSVLPDVLHALAVPPDLLCNIEKKPHQNTSPPILHIERIRLANQIYCQKNNLPKVTVFYDRPISGVPEKRFGFKGKINQSLGKNTGLWNAVDRIIMQSVRTYSTKHLQEPYTCWRQKFNLAYGDFFLDNTKLKPAQEIKNWEYDLAGNDLDSFPADLLEAVAQELGL